MPELVEESVELVVGKQGRAVGCRLGEIGDYAYERPLLHTIDYPLSAEFRHPRSAPLALAREEVGVEEGQMAAVFVLDVIYLDILVVAGDILAFLETDAVKSVCELEDGRNAVLQAEVRLQGLVAEREFRILVAL